MDCHHAANCPYAPHQLHPASQGIMSALPVHQHEVAQNSMLKHSSVALHMRKAVCLTVYRHDVECTTTAPELIGSGAVLHNWLAASNVVTVKTKW